MRKSKQLPEWPADIKYAAAVMIAALNRMGAKVPDKLREMAGEYQ